MRVLRHARRFYGANNVGLLRYTVKEYTMSTERHEEMLETPRSAKVATEPGS